MTHTDSSLIDIAKKAAGSAAAGFIKEGMLIGLGTGSTAAYFIDALGQRCQEGLKITAVASSQKSLKQAQEVGIPLIDNALITTLDLTVDGADEIDSHKNMIKGGGGALLREKILAKASNEMIVIVDENKCVSHLGHFPVPIEIASFAYQTTLYHIKNHGYHCHLRLQQDGKIYCTDNGNYIVDIQFDQPILHPEVEYERLRPISGIIEIGLFFGVAGRVIIGYEDGTIKVQS